MFSPIVNIIDILIYIYFFLNYSVYTAKLINIIIATLKVYYISIKSVTNH